MMKPGRSSIPRIIWQTYRTRELHRQAAICQASWISRNPGWEYRFLDDTEIDSFVKEHASGEAYDIFRRLPLGVMRADFWRYLATLTCGGLYADIDTVCLEPVDNWLPRDAEFVVAPENETHLCQWTFLSAPDHPCLHGVLELLLERAKDGIRTEDEHFVHRHTGPGVWTDGILGVTGCAERNMISLSRSGRLECLNRLNVRVLGWRYFREWKVRHLFGSLNWKEEYGSWVRERELLLRKR